MNGSLKCYIAFVICLFSLPIYAMEDVDLRGEQHRVAYVSSYANYCATIGGIAGGVGAAGWFTKFTVSQLIAASCSAPVVIGAAVGTFVLTGVAVSGFGIGIGCLLRECIEDCQRGCTRNLRGTVERVA